jgi:hypothetical protein
MRKNQGNIVESARLGDIPGTRDPAGELRARDAEVKRADVFGERLTAEKIREIADVTAAGDICGGRLSVSSEFMEDAPEAARARAVEFVEAFLSMARDTGLDVKLSGRLVKR